MYPLTRHRYLVSYLILGLVLLLSPLARAQSPFGAGGSRSGRTLDSSMPNEAVDPFSGTLTIAETDLVLPGNAGLDLRIQRVYSSAIYPGYQNNDLTLEEDSWAGIGWKLHFGRVINPDSAVGGQTQIEMGDGSRQALYSTPISPGWITKSFWLYDKNTHVLKLPNGIIYTFEHQAYLGPQLGTVRYVTEIRDPYNNRIEFSYFTTPADGVSQIRQYLGGGQVRQVDFTVDTTGLNAISSMTFNGRTWNYYHVGAGPAGYSRLFRVAPPAGKYTEYEYSNSAPGHELTVVHAPVGGTITYTYGDVIQVTGSVTTTGRGVITKTLGGYQILAGTWTYSYGTGTNHDTTRVVCPCGTTTFRFNGIGNTGNFSGWLAGTLAEQTVEEQGAVLRRDAMTWIQSEVISSDSTTGVGGVWSDPAVRKALPSTSVTTRGLQSWTTTQEYHDNLGNFNDYGRPWKIYHDGELHRIITRSFQYGFAPYIVDRIAQESVTIAGQTVPRFWEYDLATGFLTRQSLGAVLWTYPYTLYERTPEGNVSAIVDANGNRTTLFYSWGQMSEVRTPGTRTIYDISPNGWVMSVSNTVDTATTFTYDPAGRPTSISATGVNPTGYEYDTLYGEWVKVARGSSWTKTYLDGFGRQIKTINSVGLQTRVGRDECGRQNFVSYPFTSGWGPRGVTTTYDALARVKTVVDGDANATTQYSYVGADVTVTDPNNRQTQYIYGGFSGPDDARLVRVRDAAGQDTYYTYDAFDHLTSVTGPGSTPPRTWTYDVLKGRLTSETQPENGTTSYEYDNAGNRTKTTTSDGDTLFTYDGDNRAVLQNPPGTSDDVAFEYDAVGRLKRMAIPNLTSPTSKTTYTYDTVGRLTTRQDLVLGQTYQSTNQYDANDRLTALLYPSGRTVSYDYDSEGRPLVVHNNTSIFANGFTYTDAGKLATYTTGAVTHSIAYDSRERVQRLTSGSALDLTYSYDPASQVTGIADPRPYMSATFGYDALGRLNTAIGIWGMSTWTYDVAGNRLSETRVWTQTNYQYSAATQRLLSTSGASTESFGYDARGRLTSDSQGTYTYNARELLATVTKPGLSASYTYDPSGLRVASTVNADTSISIRGAGGEVLSEYRSACPGAGWARDAVYVGGRLIGSVRAANTLPTVTLTSASGTAAESQTSQAISVRLTTANGAPTACPVTVVYSTTAGSAIAGSDFTATNGTLTFLAGTPSGTVQSVYVTLLPDSMDEYDEVFHVRLTTATGATIVSPSSQAVTILDDDALPTISITDVSVSEGANGSTPAVFTVSLSAVSGRVVQVDHVNWNGTAVANADYQLTSGTLTFPPGTTSLPISVPVFGDGIVEPNETFYVHLSNPVFATIADADGLGTILNDDTLRHTWGDINVPLDGAADGALFRPSTALWTFRDSNTNAVQTFGPWGITTDIPVPNDYDGDGKTDCAVYRPSEGAWYVYSACGQIASSWGVTWGQVNVDQPAPADYDGDGKTDIAIYRPTDGYWWVILSATGAPSAIQWGQSWTTSLPVPRDYDGDGKADRTFYTPFNGVWWILHSTTGATELIGFGIPNDTSVVPTPADYDGDGKADLAYFAPATATWYIKRSSTGQEYSVPYGTGSMIPVPADYDADGKTDIAHYDPTNRVVWVLRSTSGQSVPILMSDISAPGDIPILRRPQ